MTTDYKQILLSKNGMAVSQIASLFIKYEIGDRTLTISELTDSLNVSRGTVQLAIKTLQDAEAFRIESRGHMGSYLVKKNVPVLLQFAGITSLVGTMPLPYSKKYEGMATGLMSSLENNYGIAVALSYMRGAKNRIAMVIDGRYDFAVISKYAEKEFLQSKKGIVQIKEFGPESYCSSHVLLFHNPKETQIRNGMKVGIDADSIDQSDMVRKACKGKKVNYIPVEYNSLLERIVSGDLDATVWNLDEITDKMKKINFKIITQNDYEDTNAVIVTSSSRPEIGALLSKMIDEQEVMRIQQLVLDGKITPSY